MLDPDSVVRCSSNLTKTDCRENSTEAKYVPSRDHAGSAVQVVQKS